MLTGRLVRVRFVRDRIVPQYLDVSDPLWVETAERLLELFRAHQGKRRGELEEAVTEAFGEDPSQLVPQGLAKLLEDRSEFETVAGLPPEQLREAVFAAAARQRQRPADPAALHPHFDRAAVLQDVAGQLGLTPEVVAEGLFADLKSEQRLVTFKDLTADRLLRRYNVGLAQAVVLRATAVRVEVRGEPPRRLRQLLRRAKFHRLVCEALRQPKDKGFHLTLDGPLSLFTATQKYGLQLALFLPAVLPCQDFTLTADLLWGPERKPKKFVLTPPDGLTADGPDVGTYVPAEVAMFADLFRRKVDDWELTEEADLVPLGDGGFWVPDFRLVHKASGGAVLLEILGFWRRSGVEKLLERLRQHVRTPFLLAVSKEFHVEEADLAGLPAAVHHFRSMPQYDEIVRLAAGLLPAPGAPGP
jgi:predicted nuclease of restriction endonuclease-like RecB superfamily